MVERINNTLLDETNSKEHNIDNKIEVFYCKTCAHAVKKGQKVCLNCGFEPLFGNSYCSTCGNAIKFGQVICINCGFEITTFDSLKKNVEMKTNNSKQNSDNDYQDNLLSILAILIPISGLIMYMIYYSKDRANANKFLAFAITSFFIWFFLLQVFFY